ncbi:hypothetical protein DER46DRAFT_577734 [Fusarium sp. MPI-SDFR-AT-0072]|nr:hypothetical protein DER46DRAFT_577734 [Fusarium sp. MPI-SDFR-AT-0072]
MIYFHIDRKLFLLLTSFTSLRLEEECRSSKASFCYRIPDDPMAMAISTKPSRTRMVTDPAAHLCRQGLDICQSPAITSCNRQRGGYGWLRILARPTHGHAAKQDTCTGDVTISGPARLVSPWCKERPRHARAGQTAEGWIAETEGVFWASRHRIEDSVYQNDMVRHS